MFLKIGEKYIDTIIWCVWRVYPWKGYEFITLASDVSFDFPVCRFYSGYSEMMVTRHMKEFWTTVEQMAAVMISDVHSSQDCIERPRISWSLPEVGWTCFYLNNKKLYSGWYSGTYEKIQWNWFLLKYLLY